MLHERQNVLARAPSTRDPKRTCLTDARRQKEIAASRYDDLGRADK
jgi:hypothetical protein